MIPSGELPQQLLLLATVVLPLLGAVAALLPAPPGLRGRDPEQAVLRHGVTVTGAVLLAAVLLALTFDHDEPGTMQAEMDVGWIPALGTRLHLGVDGVSLPLLVLSALLTFLCALYCYFRRPEGPSPAAFTALLLLLEGGTLATFAVLDLVLFFLAFETVLIPMYFLIARWGGAGRALAAWKFILYTLLGSVVMLLGLLLLGLSAEGGPTFDMRELAEAGGAGVGHGTQLLVVLAVGAGLAVKTPMWPLHSWLPDAHTSAPTAGSVLLAGVLLKMGTYGFVRILLPAAPDGMRTLAPYLAAFAVVGIVYGSLACLALVRRGAGGDLKRLIAYSSVGHMGFVLLGIATLTHTGVNGALFANVAHGLITGLLFFLAGALKDRTGTTDLDALAGSRPMSTADGTHAGPHGSRDGVRPTPADERPERPSPERPSPERPRSGAEGEGAALYGRAPRFGGLLAFAAVASLGLPGLAGFWGEMLALLGAYHPADGLNRAAYAVFLACGAFGTLLTAAYMLLVVRRVCMGDPVEPRTWASGQPVRSSLETTASTVTSDPTPQAVNTPQAINGTPEPDGDEPEPGGYEPEPGGYEPEPDGGTPEPDGDEPEPGGYEPEPGGGEPEPDGDEPEPGGGEPKPDGDEPKPEPDGGEPARGEDDRPHTGGRGGDGDRAGALTDVRPYELAAWSPLAALTVVVGLWPATLLSLTDPAVQLLLPGVTR